LKGVNCEWRELPADDSVFSFSDSGLLDELAIEAGVV